jgi:tetratricopeptide (TPR) repeat protein
MDQQPPSPGQLLPCSAYASISRDALFVAAFRRLYFTSHSIGGDPSRAVAGWLTLLENHRYASIIAAFDPRSRRADPQTIEAVRGTDMSDIWERMNWINSHVRDLKPTAGAATRPADEQRRWIDNYPYHEDYTTWDLAHTLWVWRGKEADAAPMLGLIKGEIAKSLNLMCPDHPAALAELIVNRWPDIRPRAAEIEKEMSGNPQVAYALARAYRSEKRLADAARLLEATTDIAPDEAVYEELAEIYKQEGNADKWLEIYDKYLSSTEQLGLEHARRNENVAYTLMGMKQPEKALKYAKAAADSNALWALRCLAACLTELGQYDEAEAVERSGQEQYPNGFNWYRWCRITGKGDLEAARALSKKQAAAIDKVPGRQDLNDVAIYFVLEGDLGKARKTWQRQLEREPDQYTVLQLAMLDLEEGKPDAAKQRLENSRAVTLPPNMPPELAKLLREQVTPVDDTRGRIYQAAVNEIKRCLEDANAVPLRDGPTQVILGATDTPWRGCATYFLGRFCELRGKTDDAKWWYRQSMETAEWTNSCRPQSAAALRRLGEEYYK